MRKFIFVSVALTLAACTKVELQDDDNLQNSDKLRISPCVCIKLDYKFPPAKWLTITLQTAARRRSHG